MFLFIITFLVGAYLINNILLNHWQRENCPQQFNSKWLFGDFKDSILHRKSFAENLRDIYEKCKSHRVIGLYLSYRPVLMINDPKIISSILLKDSNKFPDRGYHSDGSFDELSDQLFFQGGEKWKKLREILSRAFTTNKLKATIPTSIKNLSILENFMVAKVKNGVNIFDMRELVARLNTNIISSVAYGLDIDTITEPDHIMRKMGAEIFEPSFIAGLRWFIAIFLPIFNQIFKFKVVNDQIETFFKEIMSETVKHRESNKSYQRDDLIQKLIQLKNEGFGKGDKISLSEVFAQSFGFYLGGFETTSSTVSFGLYELAKHPKIQRRVQKEIDEHFKPSDDIDAAYEMISKLQYLKCVMNEILRKYTPLPVLSRQCNEDYNIEDSDYVIKRGTPIFIPIYALHRDENIFEDPIKFNPDRFLNNPSGGGYEHVDGLYYLPLGEGRRICIGNRMGKLNVRYQLATLLSKFSFELQDETGQAKELKFNPKSLFLQPLGNINLKVTLRK